MEWTQTDKFKSATVAAKFTDRAIYVADKRVQEDLPVQRPLSKEALTQCSMFTPTPVGVRALTVAGCHTSAQGPGHGVDW